MGSEASLEFLELYSRNHSSTQGNNKILEKGLQVSVCFYFSSSLVWTENCLGS
ncbi:hypothetical protein Hanom_Chr17g01559001 [Helianthus anomalus]